MDTSETYIKMCENAKEIQKQWISSDGDYYVYFIVPHEPNIFIRSSRYGVDPVDTSHWIWLPRQDQLQKMIGEFPYPFALIKYYLNKVLYYNDKRPVYPLSVFKSGEQLWVAFVMHEKIPEKVEWCNMD